MELKELNHLKKLSNSLHAKIDLYPVSKEIGPGKSFYRHVNEEWLSKVKIPPHISRYSASTEVNEYIDTFLYKIILDSTKNSGGQYSHIKKTVETLTLSLIRPEVQNNNVDVLKHAVRSMACIHTIDDIASTMGGIISSGIGTLLAIGVDLEPSSKKYIFSIGPGKLSLEPEHYFMNNKVFHSDATKRHYKELLSFIKKEFDLTQSLEEAVHIESHIAKEYAYLNNNEIKIVSIKTLKSTYENIPWDHLFKAIGVDPHNILINCPFWIKKINTLFKTIPVSGWISLLSVNVLMHGLPTLPDPFKSKIFYFIHSVLNRERLSSPPPNLKVLETLKEIIPKELGLLFIKKYLTEGEKKDAINFTQEIINAAVERIKINPWMDGKKKVIQKIKNMDQYIFYSDSKEPSHKDLQKDCFLNNIYSLAKENTKESLKYIGSKEGADKSWTQPPYTVNAYYYTIRNLICIPAASFFFPLYDTKKLGWNYGGIGATIGHEISHAFDEEGQLYDEAGENNPIWSTNEKREYTKRLNLLAKLFSHEKVFSVHLHGEQTVSENLADLGGIQIALQALKNALKGATPEKRLYELREFFISYATSWRTVTRHANALTRIYTDPHAPAQQRVDLIVAQVDEWYEAFNILPSDKMYIKPEDRIVIF